MCNNNEQPTLMVSRWNQIFFSTFVFEVFDWLHKKMHGTSVYVFILISYISEQKPSVEKNVQIHSEPNVERLQRIV